jgi:hypothetical protein
MSNSSYTFWGWAGTVCSQSSVAAALTAAAMAATAAARAAGHDNTPVFHEIF